VKAAKGGKKEEYEKLFFNMGKIFHIADFIDAP
jgi:hypothetical protein